MSTTVNERKPHSAEYFGEYRDFWWNADFLELIAKRMQLHQAKNVLDVGCGIGHWSQLLAPVLPQDGRVTGIDREDEWVAKAKERAIAFGLQERYHYEKGDVISLPFADSTFDLVTCQTVLIHLKDPKQGLREMLRVVKPGGIILAAEPNNFANRAVFTSLTERMSVDEVVDRMRFDLMVERGKQALGLGFNSVGDLIPGYLAEVGAENIRVYLSDKATPFVPPYSSKDQQVNIQLMRDWAEREFIGWDCEEVLGYFLAGGGREEEFERYHKLLLRDASETLKAIEQGTYHSAGGGLTYLITAQKPRQ
jgi:2-polyprenyl-3-methyl-5-hydroxy-6-metoxy-1,4-benzoquinol methylase